MRMKDKILPKRSETKKQGGRRKRGRPQSSKMGGLAKETEIRITEEDEK